MADAWYLESGSADFVSISPLVLGGIVGDYIEFDVEALTGNKNGEYRLVGNSPMLILRPADIFQTTTNVNYTQPAVGQRFTLKVVKATSTTFEYFLGGVVVGSRTIDTFSFSQFLKIGTSGQDTFFGKTYRIKASTDGGATVTNDWNPTLSNGTGTVLTDSVGGNNGTLVAFPVDNSQWVLYDDGTGGATFTLLFDAGAYAYTGNTFDLAANRSLSLDSGVYAYTGQDLSLSFGRNITLDSGSYAYTGQDINLKAGRNVSLDSGAYLYNGQDLNLKADRKLLFDAGSYAYIGQDLTLLYTPVGGPTYTINLDAGTYQITGNDITLAANRAILLDAGTYSYTGQSVVLATNRKLSLDAGSYAVTGNDSSLIVSRKMSLDTGAYIYSGAPMTLDYSGQIISLISQYSVNYANDDLSATFTNSFITARFL